MHKREKYPEHYPEEYITRKVNFFGRDFWITPEVLIPRLETESLVRRARQVLHRDTISRVIDIGTGSGIIGVSCADMVDELIFLDISPEALSVAQENFRTHFPKKDAQFIVSDLLENIPSDFLSGSVFVANLPYIK
jgi:release factor glutamine methyltransferase